MKNISIGTCIPGTAFEQWAPAFMDKGFERFSINFHMQFGGVDLEQLADKVHSMLDGSEIRISSLGYYCNALLFDEHRQGLEHCIDLAHRFGTDVVSTFAGCLTGQSVDASMPRFRDVFGELARRAEDRGVRIAIENCPMGGTWQHTTDNIGFNSKAWDMMFNEVPSPALGLEWEPAHQIHQLVDPIANLRKWVGRVVHVHGKDATVNQDILHEQGIHSADDFVDSRFPGLGQTDWRQIFTILQKAGFDGTVSIEGYHDPLFTGEWEMTGQIHALNYLKWCRGGSFTANAWQE